MQTFQYNKNKKAIHLMQELILFPNYKAKNNYLKDKFKNYTKDITNYQILHKYYKDNKEKFLNSYKIETGKQDIDESIAIINIHNILGKYKEKNKNSLIAKQNITYELSFTLYKLIEEITLATFYGFNIESYKSLKEIDDIIKQYKKYNKENNLLDEFDVFELFIDAVQKKQLDYLNEYNKITIYSFEKIPPMHLIFLENIKKYYNIDVKVIMPYDMKKYFPHYRSFYQGIDNFEINECSALAKSLIEKTNLENFKERIKFIAGFGAKQEADTVIDEIIKLREKGVNLYDIGIIFSDIQKYGDIVSNRLKECGIKFNERRANFVWKMPIIPVLTSIFLILDKYNGELDIDVLIKVLSSSYIKNLKGINPYNIRDLIYSYNRDDKLNKIEIYSKMSLNDFKDKISKKFNNNDAAKTIIEFLNLLNILVSKKTYKEIGLAYINILKFLQIGKISPDDYDDENYYYRDNEALALFINLVLIISYTEEIESLEGTETVSHYDFQTALNVILRDKSLMDNNNKEEALTVSNLYDARGLRFKYIFILGMNNDFINRKPNGFFISSKLREDINKDLKKIAFNTNHYLSDISYALFLNILSSCYDESSIYFSFRLKDEKGNWEVPFYYLEDLYNIIYKDDFKFENLIKNGLIYRKEYIQKPDNIHTQKENMMSLFLYNDVADNIDNLESITEKVYHKKDKNGYNNFEHREEEIKEFFDNIFSKPVSVTTLQSVMECPAKFFYTSLYSRDSVESKVQGISYMDKGSTYHSFFQKFYEQIKNNSKSFDISLKESEFNTYCNIADEVIEEHINGLINLYSEKDLEEKYFEEYKLDQNIIKKEASNVMHSFIKKECIMNKLKDENEGYHYIPYKFEKWIGGEDNNSNSIIYKKDNFTVQIRGVIDRIDLSYKDNNNINGIRIVDYKGSYRDDVEETKKHIKNSNDPYNDKELIKEIIIVYLQPILYLKLLLDELIKENISEKIKHCEVVFTIYKERLVIDESKEINQVYDDRDMLLSICGYKDGIYNLQNYFDEIFENILKGKLPYLPSKRSCNNCYNAPYCENAYQQDEDNEN